MPWHRNERPAFADRRDAGRQLADITATVALEHPIVLSLPRGGVAVGCEVACRLQAPLDVVVARKLGAAHQPELAIGAVAADGAFVLDEPAVARLGIARTELLGLIEAETAEVARRTQLYRGDRPFANLPGRDVVLVDDGLATGLTVRAAIQYLRRLEPRAVVLAVPVSARDTAIALRPIVDDLIVVHTPPDFRAVGQWYFDFTQLTDDDVLRLLESNDCR